jgi:hypothetical protein
MLEARVLGIPHVEDGEVIFAVWVQRSSSSVEVVRVTTPDPDVVYVEAHGHSDEVAEGARAEVVRWIEFQRRFMDRLYARLNTDRNRRPVTSHVRPAAPSVAPGCALCRGTGESEKFFDRSGGHARWAFGPKLSEMPFRERGTFVPCPACRRIDYDHSVDSSVSAGSLSAELERVEAIVTGRIATIREKIRSTAPRSSSGTQASGFKAPGPSRGRLR